MTELTIFEKYALIASELADAENETAISALAALTSENIVSLIAEMEGLRTMSRPDSLLNQQLSNVSIVLNNVRLWLEQTVVLPLPTTAPVAPVVP
jgi:hypothetical protein